MGSEVYGQNWERIFNNEEAMKKKQGYNDKMDESLGMRNGKKKQTMKSRRKESKGMEKASGKRAYSAVKSMDKKKSKKSC